MGINLVVAVTDDDWFEMLRHLPNLNEVNFWAPSAANFRALQPGELFLFKLHAPRNAIVGGGIFAYANTLPCSLAWASFGEANGAHSLQEMRARIARYRKGDPADRSDFQIGCRILTQPFFFDESAWLPVPASWSRNIVAFKTYNTGDSEGLALWEAANDCLASTTSPAEKDATARFGKPQLIHLAWGKALFVSLSLTFISAVARSLKSGPCQPWKLRTFVLTAKEGLTRLVTGCSSVATFTASSMPDM
jgi:putative restriction endonuclease